MSGPVDIRAGAEGAGRGGSIVRYHSDLRTLA
jgi:hypothetical protein